MKTIEPASYSPLTERAVSFIAEKFQAESFSVQIVAQHCGVSRRVLERQFRSELGCSPLNIITHFRINHAKNLLLATDEAVTEIAEDIGFADVKSLRHHFRNQTGTTPGCWRKKQKSQTSLTNQTSPPLDLIRLEIQETIQASYKSKYSHEKNTNSNPTHLSGGSTDGPVSSDDNL